MGNISPDSKPLLQRKQCFSAWLQITVPAVALNNHERLHPASGCVLNWAGPGYVAKGPLQVMLMLRPGENHCPRCVRGVLDGLMRARGEEPGLRGSKNANIFLLWLNSEPEKDLSPAGTVKLHPSPPAQGSQMTRMGYGLKI